MNPAATNRLLIALAVGVALAGFVWTLHSLRSFPAHMRALERRQTDIEKVRALQRTMEGYMAAVHLFESLPEQRPPEPGPLIRGVLPNGNVDARYRETQPVWEGWQTQRYDIHLDEAPLAQLGSVLALLESQRPPWRPVEIGIAAEGPPGGEGRVTLIVEGLFRR